MCPEPKRSSRYRDLRTKPWVWTVAFLIIVLAYKQDAVRGSWKFERLCKEGAGAHFYGKIEKGQGWIVDSRDTLAYQVPFDFGDVAFVRYENAKGERFDVTKASDKKNNEFEFFPENSARSVRYRVTTQFPSTLPDDSRFSRSYMAVIDLRNGQTLATYITYSYRWTKPERVILNAPTGVTCPDDGGKSYRELTLQMGGW